VDDEKVSIDADPVATLNDAEGDRLGVSSPR
jgi:hypothetical protein